MDKRKLKQFQIKCHICGSPRKVTLSTYNQAKAKGIKLKCLKCKRESKIKKLEKLLSSKTVRIIGSQPY